MIREAIGVAETITLAQQVACKQLGVNIEDAEFEVIQMPEKKKFGLFGGSPAKVKATVNISPIQIAKEYLEKILNLMGAADFDVEVVENNEGAEFNILGENIGFIIGHRGETLDSLQYLTGLVANQAGESYYRITINTGSYREKRIKTLEILGRNLAFKAIKTGQQTSLEPMNPYERRIIHTAVQGVNGAISWSEGENLNRHVVIGPDPKGRTYNRNRGGYNRNNGNRNSSYNSRREYKRRDYSYNNNSRNSPEDASLTGEPIVNRVPLDEGSALLYGKIEVHKD